MALARFKRLILGTGLTGTDNGDDTITVAVTSPSPAFATPAIALSTAAAAGAASTVIRSDSTIVAFDATVPSTQAFGDSAATGAAAVAARRDHKHAMPANPLIETGGPTTLAFGSIPNGNYLVRSGTSIIGGSPTPGGPPTGAAGGALDGTYPNPGIAASVAGAGLAETSDVLSVNVDNSSIEISTDTLRVKAGGITAAMLASGVAGNWFVLADSTLGADAASIDFTSISGSYAHLWLLLYARSDTASGETSVAARFNNDSGANYYHERINAGVTTVTAAEVLGATSFRFGRCPANTATANDFGANEMVILNYANSTNRKSVMSRAASFASTASSGIQIELGAEGWDNTAAISRITMFPGAGNFRAGTRATLYGLSV